VATCSPPSGDSEQASSCGPAQRVFTAAQVQAACGQPLLSLLDPQASHWLVAYSESKLWTIIVDGSCVLSALDLPPSVEPVAGATYEAEAPDGALQSISYLRFPPGRVTDGTN